MDIINQHKTIIALLILALILIPMGYFLRGLIGKKFTVNVFDKSKIIIKFEELFILWPYTQGSKYNSHFIIVSDNYLKIRSCFHKNKRNKLLKQYWKSLIIFVILLVISIYFTLTLLMFLLLCVLLSYISGIFFDSDNYYSCDIVIVNKLLYWFITIPGQRGRQLVEK